MRRLSRIKALGEKRQWQAAMRILEAAVDDFRGLYWGF